MAVGTAFGEWLSEGEIARIGGGLHDPSDVTALRSRAFAAFRDLPLEPNPLYRKYGYFAGVDLSKVDPTATGASVPLPSVAADVVRIVHDAAGSRVELPPELAARGVAVTPLAELWSGPEGTRTTFLRGIDTPADRLSALAIAVLNRGYRLTVPARLAAPVRLHDVTVLSRPHEAISVRRTVEVGAGSRLLAVEETHSTSAPPDQRLVASSTELAIGDGSQAAYLTVHVPDGRAVAIYSRSARLERAAKMGWVWAGYGGFRTKCRNTSTLAGQGSDLEDLQTFFGADAQSYDSAITIEHQGTDTHGQSMTRGVFRDEARGMSRGLVRIEKEARKTVSYLSEHAMLLSRGARSDTIPILEILCRDVKATHSTSVAPVDPEKVFYLESRGLPRSDAVRAISEGFLGHILDRAPIGRLSDALYPHLARRWAGEELVGADGAVRPLARADFAADVPPTDWRFDAKLR